jgi:uncharacterized membrane protein YkvA (DUF1232 family)
VTDIWREKPQIGQTLMKPKSKLTKLVINPSKPTTAAFGQVSPTEWRIAGKIMTIDEIIEDEAQYANSTDLRMLESFSGRLLDKLKESNSDEYPGLPDAVKLIILVLESPAAQQAKDPLPRWLAETAFAAAYLLKKFDLIPDHLPEIGLADDALILQRVIKRNQAELSAVWPNVSTLTACSSH